MLTAFDRFFISNLAENNKIVQAVRNESRQTAVNKIADEMILVAKEPLDDDTATALAKKIEKKLKIKTAQSVSAKASIQKAVLDARIEIPRDDFAAVLSDMIYAKSWEPTPFNPKPKGEITLEQSKVLNEELSGFDKLQYIQCFWTF